MKCGIDLGTTFSVISWYDELNKKLISIDLNCESGASRILRSAVYFPGQGKQPLVGSLAYNAKKQHPDRVAIGVKRMMGRGDWKFRPGDGEEYTPAQVSAEILKTLINEAQAFMGEAVEEVVVTVPAYFEEAQKNATLEAALLAGIPEGKVKLLEEPQAAALAYCIENAMAIDDE
jgi:molecular chaperone DnaK (HSP70)